MQIQKLFFVLSFLFFVTTSFGQTIQGYSFASYPANVSTSKKASLNLKSHPLGRSFRTMISEQYKQGKVDFGGHYITTMWGAGMGLTLGAMVDIATGKIYELPLSEENSYRGTYYDENNNILYKATSNLFICYSSSANEKNENLVDLVYYFYRWNDATKKFTLLKTKSVSKSIDN